MNFRDKKEVPSKYIYLFLAAVCFILLFVSVIFEDHFSPLKAVTSTIITPMQSGVNEVGASIFNGILDHKEKKALMEENAKLNEQLNEYKAQMKLYEQESYELKRLQELLALKEQYAEYNTVGARVIATDSTNWFYTFVIDKGSDDGVQVGCNILAGNGLAGIVTEVGNNYAKVRSIIDDNSNVSATISGTDTLCTVSGNLSCIKDGYIDVGYINKADTIEEGAELVTSHVSDKFLPGLLIGYISEVEMDANNLTKSAKCIPVVDFANLQEVLVILDMKADLKTDSTSKNIYDSITSDNISDAYEDTDNDGTQSDSGDSGSTSDTSEDTTSGANTSEDNHSDESTSSEDNLTGEHSEESSSGEDGSTSARSEDDTP